MNTVFAMIGAVAVALAIVVAFALLMAFPMMWLVNYLFSEEALTTVFGTATIGFWKALFLNTFLGIAFQSHTSSSSKS